jgi:hypothetical protein
MSVWSPVEPSVLVSTRRAMHVVAAHLLGRRRFAVTGRFGLRASPGGFTTGPFGTEPETLRVAGTTLVREVGGRAGYRDIPGTSLRALATFAGADLDDPFSAGTDTPPIGDPDRPLQVDAEAVAVLAEWLALGWRVLDAVVSSLPDSSEPATVQLWPEHFDAGTNVALASGGRVNLGFSPGDDALAEPYAYVGPWGDERPGDAVYWNVPFGAALTLSALPASTDPFSSCRAFVARGLTLLSSS